MPHRTAIDHGRGARDAALEETISYAMLIGLGALPLADLAPGERFGAGAARVHRADVGVDQDVSA